jgi:hypothetical protein
MIIWRGSKAGRPGRTYKEQRPGGQQDAIATSLSPEQRGSSM